MSSLHHQDASAEIANTLGLPCVARRVFRVDSSEDVRGAIEWSRDSGLPLYPIGAGSNVVLPPLMAAGIVTVGDESVSVVSETPGTAVLRVGAGKNWHTFVADALDQGFYGLENLALIPGLVGAAPVQNIGAYGRELEEFVTEVHGVSLVTGDARSLSATECGFAYRDSIFKRELRDEFLITSVDFQLDKVPAVNVEYPVLRSRLGEVAVSPDDVFRAVVALRTERLPAPEETPNAGSFFKNPVLSHKQLSELQLIEPKVPVYPVDGERFKVSAAWLIERAGLRGYCLGPVAISDKHALVLVNHGSAVQSDVLALAKHVQDRVNERFSVLLEPEPRFYD